MCLGRVASVLSYFFLISFHFILIYSPCPLLSPPPSLSQGTTRAIKYFEYEGRDSPDVGCTFNSSLTSAQECYDAAAGVMKSTRLSNATVSDNTKPPGCVVDGSTDSAVFNTAAASTTTCDSMKSTQGQCICRGMNGWIDADGAGKRRFSPGCMGLPKSELLATHNPTCDINQYDGGLQCCGDKFHLLDADQEVPALWDEVYFKTRWYYEDYAPATMKPTYHLEWQFGECARTHARTHRSTNLDALKGTDYGGVDGRGSPRPQCSIESVIRRRLLHDSNVRSMLITSSLPGHIEYSVPKAPAGTPAYAAIHKLETHFTVKDFLVTGNQNAGGFGWDLSVR